ncbi:MAG: hypothetical protein U9O95_09490 [Candidatus Marinimicrobia bacterium]|nr:hypothetical protein [Candidatus Neomarinimicrobiota bacterium]
MIVLNILLGLLLFILFFMAMMVFIPLKMYTKGTYWDKNPTGQMEVYWVKYFLGARLRIRDLDRIHILIWFLGIPIPLRLPLKPKKGTEDVEQKDNKKTEKDEEKPEDPIKVEDKEEDKKGLKEKISEIINAKDTVKDLWEKYKEYIKKLFVSYITFSFEYIDAELGLKDPAQTGMAAGIVYSALSIKPLENIKISWDYAKPNFNISAGIKMTMNLYGILRTLLSLYLRYKKDKKNEVQ